MPSPTETSRGVEWHCTSARTGVRAGSANGSPSWNYTCIMRQDQVHPILQCTGASKAMHGKGIFQKQVLNFNLILHTRFSFRWIYICKEPCVHSKFRFIQSKTLLLCRRKYGAIRVEPIPFS